MENDYDYWSRFVETYDEDNLFIIGQKTHEEVMRWLSEQLGEDGRILDLGCGTGTYTRLAAEKAGEVVAADMSREMLDAIRARLADLENVTVRQEDCYRTSFDDSSFDVVILGNVVHVVHDPVAVLRESRRVLKDGGRVLVIDFTAHGLPKDDKKAMMRRYFSRWGPIPEWSFAATVEGMTKLAENAGFVVEESMLLGEGSKAVCLRVRRD